MTAPESLNAYGRSKLEAERLASFEDAVEQYLGSVQPEVSLAVVNDIIFAAANAENEADRQAL